MIKHLIPRTIISVDAFCKNTYDCEYFVFKRTKFLGLVWKEKFLGTAHTLDDMWKIVEEND
jgi:hypothetical protein